MNKAINSIDSVFNKSYSCFDNQEEIDITQSVFDDIPDEMLDNNFGILSGKRKLPIIVHEDWLISGMGDSYEDCGETRYKGCLNVDEHHSTLDNPKSEGKGYVLVYPRSCDRKECPVCYEKWAGKRAKKAVYRILGYCIGIKEAKKIYEIRSKVDQTIAIENAFKKSRLKPIHVVYSVSKDDYDKDIRYFRSKLYKIASKSGVYGGCAIFHPYRYDEGIKKWYWSPHFHVIGLGWVSNVKKLYSRYGWIIRNKGIRKTVWGTIFYALTHAGVKEKNHVLTWFGKMSYNKFKILEENKMPVLKSVCPLCSEELRDLIFAGSVDRPPPEEAGEYFLDSKDWKVIERDNHRYY